MSRSDSPSRPGHGSVTAESRPTANGAVHADFTSTVSPARFSLLSSSVCLGLFLSIVDTSIVATSIYTIGIEFDNLHSVNWVALAYTLAYLACAVTFARISDIVGRRNAFLGAYAIFFAFSLACGFAQNLHQLIALRAVQGIGGSGLYSLSMIILPEVCPKKYLPIMGAIIGLVIAGSGVLGPVLGGILTHYTTWRWVFWINGPIAFISALIFFLAWPSPQQLPVVERRSWSEFDFLGSFLVVVAAVLVVFAFQNAGESSGTAWAQAVFIAPLVVGIVGWLALIAWESIVDRRLKHRLAPAFPVSLFRNRIYTVGALTTLLMGFPYLLLIYSFPIRAQVVSGQNPLEAGIWLLPMLGTVAVGTVTAGKMNSVKNYLFETLLLGAMLMTLGCGLLTTVRDKSDDAKALGFIVFSGLGYGFSTSAATMLVNYEAPLREYAPAQGIVAQLRILGGSLGISMSTALVDRKVGQYLPNLAPEKLATLGSGGAQLSHTEREALHAAYSAAFHDGMVVAVAVSGAAVLLTLCAYRRGDRKMVSDQRQALAQEEMARRQRMNQPVLQDVPSVEKSEA